MKSRWIAACVFAIGVSIPAAQAVDFQFGWKSGMTCKVDHVISKTAVGPQSANFTMTMRASSAPNGRMLIEVLNAKPTDAGAIRDLANAGIDPGDMGAMFQPDFFIKDGAFAELKDPKPFRAAWRKVAMRHPNWSKDPAKAESALDKMASPARQESVTRLFWNTAVESWAGLDADVDDHLTYEGEDVLPVANVPYKYVGEIHFVGMQPCRDGEKKARCAALRITQDPEPGSLARAIASLVKTSGASEKDVDQVKLEVRFDIELLTIPSTLEPSYVRLEKHVSITGVKAKDWKDISERETREWTFDCADR